MEIDAFLLFVILWLLRLFDAYRIDKLDKKVEKLIQDRCWQIIKETRNG